MNVIKAKVLGKAALIFLILSFFTFGAIQFAQAFANLSASSAGSINVNCGSTTNGDCQKYVSPGDAGHYQVDSVSIDGIATKIDEGQIDSWIRVDLCIEQLNTNFGGCSVMEYITNVSSDGLTIDQTKFIHSSNDTFWYNTGRVILIFHNVDFMGILSVGARRVYISGVNAPTSAVVGNSFTVSCTAENTVNSSCGVDATSSSISCSSGGNCKALSPDNSAWIRFSASGPVGAEGNSQNYGPVEVLRNLVINSVPPPPPPPPPPPMVNLNFFVKDQNTQPVVGALVTIDQNFGNGTTRTTDGNGFANFGVDQNKTIGWTVSAINCNSPNGSQNVGTADATVNVALNCSGSPPGTFTLTVTKSGSGTVTGPGISCGTDCGENFSQGTSVNLTATPDSGWDFSSWSGCDSTSGNSCTVSMTSNKTVTANFTAVSVTLTVTTVGSGSVVSNDGKISCGSNSTCSATYPLNATPELTATPDPGWAFSPPPAGWSGECGTIQGNICFMGMTRSKSVTATFTSGGQPSPGTISITSKEINTGNPVNTNWTLSGPATRQETNVSSKIYTNMPAGQYDLRVLVEGTTHIFDHFDITPLNQFLNSGGTLTYTIWYRSRTAPPTSCQDPSATNFGGPLPCQYPADTVSVSASCTVNVSQPPAPTVSLSSNPSTVGLNQSSILSWSSSNIDSCSAFGDWSGSKNTSGSESTGSLNQARQYNYNLICSGIGGQGSDSASVTVNATVNAPVPTASNITVTQPNYCLSGPAGTINWDYSDPSASPQTAYQVQIDDQGSFNTPEWDSGKVFCSGCRSNSTTQGVLQFNTTYKARVRTWNQFDTVSNWAESNSWKTPNNAYPQVNFTFTPLDPVPNTQTQFTDQTQFFDSNPNGRRWSWLFGDGGSSTQQNPVKSYVNEGNYNVTLTSTDNANQACSISKPINIQKPSPIWTEVNPGG